MKIAIICPDFKESNLRRLPWKYIWEVAKYLKNREFEVQIITNAHEKSKNPSRTNYTERINTPKGIHNPEKEVEGIHMISIKKLFIPFKGESQELLDVLDELKPDKCIMLMGLTSFLRSSFQINIPVYGIFTSPLYSAKELISNLGLSNSIKYRKYTAIHYLNSIIPDYMVKKWGGCFEKIIFLSNDTQKKMIDRGLPLKSSILIPVGIDKDFLKPHDPVTVEAIKEKIKPDNVPLIMYFTSPLTLRGTDILMGAFANVRKEQPCRLVFLSRLDNKELKKEEELLLKIAEREDVLDSVEFISRNLSPQEVKEYLCAADVVCLPFKIVISDVPISILEAMALGKPVISTEIASIPELLNGNGIMIPVNDKNRLKEKIMELLSSKELSKVISEKGRAYIEDYPSWTDTGILVETLLEKKNNKIKSE